MSAKAYVLPILSALLGILVFDFPALFWLGFVFLVPLFLFFFSQERLGRLIAGAMLFRWVFAAGVVYFAFEPLGWMVSSLVFIGLPLSFHLIRRYAGATTAMVSLPLLWTVWDILEARYTFLPMYVMALGNAMGASPFLGLAAWGGISGLTLFAALANTIFAAMFLCRGREPLVRFASSAAFVFLILAGWFISRRHLTANALEYSRRQSSMAIAAVSTSQEFDRAFGRFDSDILSPAERESAAALINETIRPIAGELEGNGAELVILPEDMIDLESWSDADLEAKQKFGIESGGVLIAGYRKLAQELGANIAATFTTIQNGRRYNTTFLFNREGAIISRYNKVRLAIGGEYWPFGNWRPFYWNVLKNLRPEISEDSPLFDSRYQYSAGEPALLRTDSFSFASPICVEIHYPGDLKSLKAKGAGFISHTSNNRWLSIGLNQYLRLTDNLRRIEAVGLKTPIVINGRGERPGIITPDGRIEAAPFEEATKDYNIYFGKLRI